MKKPYAKIVFAFAGYNFFLFASILMEMYFSNRFQFQHCVDNLTENNDFINFFNILNICLSINVYNKNQSITHTEESERRTGR